MKVQLSRTAQKQAKSRKMKAANTTNTVFGDTSLCYQKQAKQVNWTKEAREEQEKCGN
jgi:hypothetical protein